MEAIAVEKYIRVSPKKLKRLAEPLKSKTVGEAESMLRFHSSPSCIPLLKAVHSAASNLKNIMGADSPPTEEFVVHNIMIGQAPSFKRVNPRARGRADVIKKRASHITVVVKHID
jgi:large subunit ribosomal protein L22